MKIFDPKKRSFSWSLAEAQERRESMTDADRKLRDELIARNVDVEESVKRLMETEK